jgi:hypothetical protein
MRTLIEMIKTRIKNKIIFSYRDYVVFKHGDKSDICVLSGTTEDNAPRIRFDTTHTEGVIALDSIAKLRRSVGENVLRINGLPANETLTPYVYLLPTLSAIKTMGLITLIKYYKDEWWGDSKVGDVVVVKYR